MAELSNNPFIDHTSSALSRFPNINAVSSPPAAPSAPQYSTGWPQQQQQQQQQHQQLSPGYIGASPTGYTQQQQYFQQSQWPQQQQQQPQPQQQHQQYQAQAQAPYPSTNFQSPGTFGHQQQQFVGQGQVNPLATGYPQSQSQLQGQYSDYPAQQQQASAGYGYQQPQQTGYGGGYPPQQHQHQQQQLLAQFDPYVNLGRLSSPGPGQGQGPGSPAGGAASMAGVVGSPPPGVQHPRMFIQTHKVELEAWDPPTWRQVQNVFEALKVAWETRKRAAETQVRALGGTVGASGSATAGFFGGGPGPGPAAAGYGAYGAYGGGGGYQTPQAQEIDRLNSVQYWLTSPLSLCLIMALVPFLLS
jgi:hypothetical protein